MFATAGSAAGFAGHFGGGAGIGVRSGGFHGASPRYAGGSPKFAGPSPRFGGTSPRRTPFGPGPRSGDGGRGLGQFRGHSYEQFSADDRARWSHGAWHYGWRHGHYGSWWVVDDLWFFYDQPTYPYPDYVGWEDDGDGPAQASSYYCEDPAGYYPDVRTCYGDWEAAPQD